MSASDIPDLDTDVSELRKQIDHQIEAKRHYEKVSWQLIRILLTIIGFSLTALSILASFVGSLGMSALPDLDTTIDLELAAERLSEVGFLGEFTAALMVTLLLLSLGTLLIISIHDIFVQSLVSAFRIQRPAEIEFGPEPPRKSEIKTIEEDLHERYINIYNHNRGVIENTQNHWNDCLDYLQRGTIAFAIGVILIGPSLILSESGFLLISAIILFLSAHSYVSNNWGYRKMRDISFRKYTDSVLCITLVLVTFSAYFSQNHLEISDFLLLLSIFVGIPAIVVSSAIGEIKSENEESSNYNTRNGLLFFLLFIAAFGIEFSLGIGGPDRSIIPTYLLICALFIFSTIVGCLIGDLLDKAYQWIRKVFLNSKVVDIIYTKIQRE